MNPEEFNKLSPEEKREFVRKLIHSEEEAANISAAFLNPKTGETVGIDELAKLVGEDNAINIIIQALETQPSITSLSKEEIKELLRKVRTGNCTPQEQAMANYLTSYYANQNNITFEHNLLEAICDVLHFTQAEIEYKPTLDSLLAAISIFISVSFFNTKTGDLGKYDKNDPEVVYKISQLISKDIFNTWKASCKSLPDKTLIILALLQLALDIANELDYEIADAKDICDTLGINTEDMDESKISIQPLGSVPLGHTSSQEDEDMRDLLKD